MAVLVPLMEAAIEVLQKGYLDDDQIESSKAIMGIDRRVEWKEISRRPGARTRWPVNVVA